MLHDVLMTHKAERDEQRIALSPLLRPENFQRLKYIPLIKLYMQLLSVTSQLIEHVTYHTGLLFDKHKLGIGIRCIYRMLKQKLILNVSKIML